MENKLKFSTEAQQIYTNISSVLSVFSFRFNLFRFAHYKYYNTPMWSNNFFIFPNRNSGRISEKDKNNNSDEKKKQNCCHC